MKREHAEKVLGEFVRLFNEGRYFEAHEVLEPLWLKAQDKEKPFYQGLIQAAVCLHHLKMGNLKGALYELSKAKEKLGGDNAPSSGIDLVTLLAECEICVGAGELKSPPRIQR